MTNILKLFLLSTLALPAGACAMDSTASQPGMALSTSRKRSHDSAKLSDDEESGPEGTTKKRDRKKQKGLEIKLSSMGGPLPAGLHTLYKYLKAIPEFEEAEKDLPDIFPLIVYGCEGVGKTSWLRAMLAHFAYDYEILNAETYIAETDNQIRAIEREIHNIFDTSDEPRFMIIENFNAWLRQGLEKMVWNAIEDCKTKYPLVNLICEMPTEPPLRTRGRARCVAHIPLPSSREREQIIRFFAEDNIDPSTDLSGVAQQTEGATGAELRNLVEAARIPACLSDSTIRKEHLLKILPNVITAEHRARYLRQGRAAGSGTITTMYL